MDLVHGGDSWPRGQRFVLSRQWTQATQIQELITKWAPDKFAYFALANLGKLPDFKPWRTRYEWVNYGISNLLIHIVIKCRPSFTKSPFQPFQNVKINKEMYGYPGAVQTQRPDFEMTVSQSKRTWLTPNFGILWISLFSLWLCGSVVAFPIIYRLVPSPLGFEIRQYVDTSNNLSSCKSLESPRRKCLTPPPQKILTRKSSQTFYSLTVHEFSNGICLLIDWL